MATQIGQLSFIPQDDTPRRLRTYGEALTISVNRKGVIDLDTVKGCTMGMNARPGTGCYGTCYANNIAKQYGIDFGKSVKRDFVDRWEHRDLIIKKLLDQKALWYRIGVMGDPCHDWPHALRVIKALKPAHKTAVIITKHWIPFSDEDISKLMELDVVVNTSVSGMDTDAELRHRVRQIERLRKLNIPSIARIVSCEYGDTEWGREANKKQRGLFMLKPVIDNPLRAPTTHPRVISGDILLTRRDDAIGGGSMVSLHSPSVYLGHCSTCPDQCGAVPTTHNQTREVSMQLSFMPDEVAAPEELVAPEIVTLPVRTTKKKKATVTNPPVAPERVEFRYVESVIGSGFEEAVATLALEDGIAHRAARKNMQIHSAIICLVDGTFAGFFTFQVNREVGEFCLLQSVIRPDVYTEDLYRQMAQEIINRNTESLPMLMTTNPKSTFETPALFQSLGFATYLAMSGFEYMLHGDPAYGRMKQLAHITMTNVWNSTKADWLKFKGVWNEHIAAAGEAKGIPNPTFATREGCWQGESGFANVVTGRSHNGNASVLDPVVCEVVLRFFTPPNGRIYNPFGGGVQFGFVAGASGFRYLATEIRQNQCDANNALCSQFKGVEWKQADSSTYIPDGPVDLVFSCPPYYRVEKYIDYDGASPVGEINSLPSYAAFRDTLFAGYAQSIKALADNRFFVIMTGDSRNSAGAYHCHEAETEVFLRDQGLSVYNKIVYLEAEFTRLAQAKKTLNMRKFPKREQKIIVAYKGDISKIKEIFPPIGRL